MNQVAKTIALAAALLLSAPGVLAADLLIQNVKIINGSDADSHAATDILIQGDSVTNIGKGLSAPEGVSVVDGTNKVVTSGLFNASTQLGLVEVGAVADTDDASSDNMHITASLRVIDAFNPSSVLIPHNRMHGVTHSLIQPQSNAGLFAGTAAVVNLGDTGNIEVSDAAMVVTLGQNGSKLAGGSRAAAMAQLREAIEDARDYARNKASYNRGDRRNYRLSRHDLEALVPVVQRRLPLLVNVERAADIERVLQFAKEYNLTLILSGVSEGWRVADKIAAAKVPVIFDPIYNLPSSYETLGARLDNAKILDQAGVTIMFTGMGWQSSHNAYLVRQSAGNAVANGLPYQKAIQAITSNPAKIFGLPGYGEVKKGAKASLVLWSGDPLELTSAPEIVLINGKNYDLVSRSTQLRDRYFKRLQAK
ncbi:MAG: imidazolonepropionase-like amidohydrolase [Cryomorphaceae bacterium]|jgi:imidazolonepropionase-like amidohydrolase